MPKLLWKCELQYNLYYKMAKCLLSSLFLHILWGQGKELLMSLFGKGKSPGRFNKNTLEKQKIKKKSEFLPLWCGFSSLWIGKCCRVNLLSSVTEHHTLPAKYKCYFRLSEDFENSCVQPIKIKRGIFKKFCIIHMSDFFKRLAFFCHLETGFSDVPYRFFHWHFW